MVVESVRYVESDTSLVTRILGREVGGKQNILVMNDEAHHAYRIKQADRNGDADDEEEDSEGDSRFRISTMDRCTITCRISSSG